jgi:hypothetical protein
VLRVKREQEEKKEKEGLMAKQVSRVFRGKQGRMVQLEFREKLD